MPSFIGNIFCCKYWCIFHFDSDPPNWRTTPHRKDATWREREQTMKKKNLLKSWSWRRMHIWKAYNADIVVDLFSLQHMCSFFSLRNFLTKSLFCIVCRWVYVQCVCVTLWHSLTYRNCIPFFRCAFTPSIQKNSCFLNIILQSAHVFVVI